MAAPSQQPAASTAQAPPKSWLCAALFKIRPFFLVALLLPGSLWLYLDSPLLFAISAPISTLTFMAVLMKSGSGHIIAPSHITPSRSRAQWLWKPHVQFIAATIAAYNIATVGFIGLLSWNVALLFVWDAGGPEGKYPLKVFAGCIYGSLVLGYFSFIGWACWAAIKAGWITLRLLWLGQSSETHQ